MIETLRLENSIRETGKPKTRKQQAESGDHRHQSKIRGCKQSSQYDSAEQLNQKHATLGEYRDSSIAYRQPRHFGVLVETLKLPAVIEWLQAFPSSMTQSPCRSSVWGKSVRLRSEKSFCLPEGKPSQVKAHLRVCRSRV